MKRALAILIAGTLLLLEAQAEAAAAATAPAERPALPSAEWISSNMVIRADIAAKASARQHYRYTRETVFEELDEKGDAKSKQTKVYEVTLISGLPFAKLTSKNGKPLTVKDAREADALDKKTRDEFVKKKSVQRVDRLQTFMNKELFNRFSLRTVRRESVNGRPAYVILFEPRIKDGKESAGDSMLDRVLNQMSGTLWVDEADFEISRVTMVLGKRVSLWKGVLGALERFQMTLDRTPGVDGVWYNRSGWVLVEGRKLLDTLKFKAREEARDFVRVPQDAP